MTAFVEAIKSLDKLHFRRTGKQYPGSAAGDSDEERSAYLKRRIFEERIPYLFKQVLHSQMRKKHGNNYRNNLYKIDPIEKAEAVIETANLHLKTPELETLRISNYWKDRAYYDITTNERLPSDEEDLFVVVQKMRRRVVCDSNMRLPNPLDAETAFILGQTSDYEEDFWLRRDVKQGNENLFTFGVVNYLHCFPCLEIHRLRKEAVAAINKRKSNIPPANEHYSPVSRLEELQVIAEHYVLGKAWLINAISDWRPYCDGRYEPSKRVARCCAALLLHDDRPELQSKIAEEWEKIFANHPNVLGDTMLIQNALYMNAQVLTKDKGAQAMAGYCGLKWTNT